MEERVKFIQHKSKEVLLIDFTNCAESEMLTLLAEVQAVIAERPRNSVLVLADFTGAQVNKTVATKIKEALVFDRPHVRHSVWVGTENLPHVFYESFKHFSQRNFPLFKSREEALDWLAENS